MENPLHHKPPPRKEPYPITVKCIVDCISDKDPSLLPFREYAHSLNINFVMREYDSSRYSDDRDRVTRLPAFHIYIKKMYSETFYTNTRPYQIMQDTVEAYKKQIKKKTWISFYTNLKGRIAALFRRTVEKYDGVLDKRRITNWS
jgi:hypothetical protein